MAEGEEGRRLNKSGPRHNHGHAADVDLFEIVNGRRRKLDANNPADQKKMADFIQYSVAAGATGIGFGYMGSSRIHIGGGEEFVWRDTKRDKKLNVALPWVAEAVEKGKGMRGVAGTVSTQGGLIDGYNRNWRNPYDGPSDAGGPNTKGEPPSTMPDVIGTYMLAPGAKNSYPNWPTHSLTKEE